MNSSKVNGMKIAVALEQSADGLFPTLTEIARGYKPRAAIKGIELLAVLRELRQENGIECSRSD
jgi:hypothetical protein